MKKFASLFLAFALVFCLSACGEKNTQVGGSSNDNSGGSGSLLTHILAKERTVDKQVGQARNLANTYDCLVNKKSLKIGYLGGSLTSGFGGETAGGWRVRTTNWFKENYPNAEITEINLSIGGTSSNCGLYRLMETLIPQQPDLVFVEFAMNDAHIGFNEAASAAYMEAIIRETNKVLPKTDIIVVFTTDVTKAGNDIPTIVGQRAAAEFYGVPWINVGKAAVEAAEKEGAIFADYLVDTVHLNDRGYTAYANEVKRVVGEKLNEAKGKAPKEHIIPSGYVVTNQFDNIKIFHPDDLTFDESWGTRKNKNSYLEGEKALYHKSQNAEITFEFEGCALSLLGEFHAGVAYEITIDGDYKTVVSAGSKTEYELSVATNLVDGKHTAKVRCITKTYGGIEGFLIA